MKFVASLKKISNLGSEITEIDLATPINDANKKFLLDEFDQHHLLIIRNQKLSEEQLIEISRIFGEPVQALVPTFRLRDYPLITKHSNEKDDKSLPLGVMAPEYVFHADSYFTSNPNKATLFYSLKAPHSGGETHFVNMCYAYDTLETATQEFIKHKRVSYKNAYINQPPVEHPLIRIHSATKNKALFVNIHRALGINGLQKEEALDLIRKLYHHAIRSETVYKHQWQDGDLLIWNNVTTMHCATRIEDDQHRLLYRVLTKGDLPVT